MRQFAHFLGHHGEAFACFSRTGRLDAGVERKQVGLEGDLVNDADDVGNLLRAFLDLAHGVFGIADNLCRLHRGFICLGGSVAGFGGQLGRGVDVGRDLFNSCSCFLKRCCLLFGAPRQVVGTLGKLAGSLFHRRDAAGNSRQGAAEVLDRHIEIVAQGFEFRCELFLELER